MTRTFCAGSSKIRIILIFLCLATVSPPSVHAFGSSESDRLFRFASQLMEEQDYYRAITEYKRFLSYFPGDNRVPLCSLNIAIAYERGGKTDLAVENLRRLLRKFPDSPITGKASYEIGMAYFSAGRFTEAAIAFSEFLNHFPESRDADNGKIRLGWSYLSLWKFEEASRAFASVRKESLQYPFAQSLLKEVESGVTVPRRSPVLAGFLSAVLPGSGQFYTGRPTEGLTSFVLNGSFIWAIVGLFSHGNEVAGALLGLFETGWYTGGVFGAVNDAHKFNRKAKNDYLKDLRNRYPLPPR